MLTIGCHLSSAKGYTAMAKEAEKINANTFQFLPEIPEEERQKLLIRKMWSSFI